MSGRRQNYSEIEELNRILMVERELVLKTQENYRTLKEKYLHLTKENEKLKEGFDQMAQGADARGKLQELEARSDEIIKSMRQANQEREVRYEKFKVETVEELQNVYRKELQDQNNQIEKLRADRQELVKENDQLLDQISSLNQKMDNFQRLEKAKEMELKVKFDERLKEIVITNENKVSPRVEYLKQTIESLREEIQSKEETNLQKIKQFSFDISQKNNEIEDFRKIESSQKLKISKLESTIQVLNLQLQNENLANRETVTIEALKSTNEELVRKTIELEMRIRQEQREFSKKLGDTDERFAMKLAEFEKLCEQKDEQILDFRSHLERSETLQEALNKSEKSLQIEKAQKEKLEVEIKNLREKIQKDVEDRQKVEIHLKTERDKLEVSLVNLKKKLESIPEAPENVEKLRQELRESERWRLKDKEKQQIVITELKNALKRLERRYRDAVIKLQESVQIV